MRNCRIVFFLSVVMMAVAAPFQVGAADLANVKGRLTLAREKFDRTPKKDMTKRPVESPYAEFGELVDESHEVLKSECDQLLKFKKKDSEFSRRMTDFVQVAALSIYLDPGQINTEIALRLANSKVSFQKKAFRLALNRLDPVLKASFSQALQTEERGQREGNG